jgi:ribosomal protein S18 acetylase RimI-like enzyme
MAASLRFPSKTAKLFALFPENPARRLMAVQAQARIRALDELDIGAIVKIDERITGIYRPEVWERRVGYYLRRDPESSQVAELDGRVVGFMLGDVREGEFGIEEPSGWIERFGIDPDYRGRDLGRQLYGAITAHFEERGATMVRTLVDEGDGSVAGFLTALGLAPSPLKALEARLPKSRESS